MSRNVGLYLTSITLSMFRVVWKLSKGRVLFENDIWHSQRMVNVCIGRLVLVLNDEKKFISTLNAQNFTLINSYVIHPSDIGTS